MEEYKILIKDAMRQLFERGNFEMIELFFAPEYKAHSGEKTYSGHAFIKQFVKLLRNAIPDVKILKTEFLSESNYLVTWQRTFAGTHQKNLKGIPATNKKVKWHEMVVTRFENGKIAEEWLVSDLAFQLMIKKSMN